MMSRPVVASYLLAVLAFFLVLHFHLIAAVIAGLSVHVLTLSLAARLPGHWSGGAQRIALGTLAVLVVLVLLGAGFGLWAFLRDNGLSSLLSAAAGTLENLRRSLPEALSASLPSTVDDLRAAAAGLLREHGNRLSVAGMEGIKLFAHVLLGMVVGGMTSLHRFEEKGALPFAKALKGRLGHLTDAFEKVVYAQVSISLLNSLLTALYLFAVLPLFGTSLPMRTVLIALTFICGLLPVVGNLLSNLVIVLISLGSSPAVGLGSVVFLIAIHKLEYFTNAKIVGGRVHASAWELLCAMLLLEAIFGLSGMVAAPVAYAWVKSELKETGMV